ncbi:transposase family protein, partial [Lentibacillus salicampi]
MLQVYFHYINKLVNIPEVRVKDLSFEDDQGIVYFLVEPVQSVQDCPCCGSSRVKRNGIPYHRRIRHLPLMAWRTILVAPSINMTCKQCDAHFVWQYEFVGPKETYSHALQNQLIQQGHGNTVKAIAGFQAVPYTTAERYYKNGLQADRERTQATCIQDAIERDRLVLGIDDF